MLKKEKVVLIHNTVGMGNEGMSHVILNYLQNMDTTGLELHFTATVSINDHIRSILERYGTIHYVPLKSRDLKGYLKGMRKILAMGFDVFHTHGNSGTMLLEVLLGKLYGIKNIIIHAHSTKTNHPFLNSVLKVPMMHMADLCLACSAASGEWLYGKHPHIVLNNAIDLERFAFSEVSREKYRAEFGLKDELLVGHIGHFTVQKNHFFLIDIFNELHKREKNTKLLLIGGGPRFEQVKAKVAELGLQDAVIFAGRRNDIAGIYSAMDLFILPSNWEGLPLVMVEAQTNGLPLLVSDVITADAKCTDRTFYKPLADGAEDWAEQILQIKSQNYHREADVCSAIAEHGFDIRVEADKLRKLYLR